MDRVKGLRGGGLYIYKHYIYTGHILVYEGFSFVQIPYTGVVFCLHIYILSFTTIRDGRPRINHCLLSVSNNDVLHYLMVNLI